MKKCLFIAIAVLLVSALVFAAADPLAHFFTDTGKSYASKGEFKKPTQWAAGQYVVTGQKLKGKVDSVSTSLIVGKEGTGWILEFSSIDKKGGETVMQMMLSGFDEAATSGDNSKITLGWIKIRDEAGNVQKLDGQALMLYNTFAKSSYEKLLVSIGAFADGGTQKVPAGTFAGTTYQKSSVKVMGMKVETEAWYHPSVPVSGMVKTQTTDGKTTTELLSFGFDGKAILK